MVQIGNSNSPGICLTTILLTGNLLHWDGSAAKHLRNMHQVKWRQWASTRIKMDIFLMLRGGYGTKQTSTITVADETHIEFCGQMMA